MALTAATGALERPHGLGVQVADRLSPSARRALLVAGVAASGFLGVLAPQLGAGTTLMVLVGGAALLAALVSSYAALALLIVLLLVPLGAAGDLPIRFNEIDAVYGVALLGLAMRTVMAGDRPVIGPLGLALGIFILAGVVALVAGVLGSAETAKALSHFRGLFGYALIPVLVLSLGERGADRRRTLVYLFCAVGALTAARGVLSWAELNGVIQLGGVWHRLASPDDHELVGVVPALSGNFGYLRAWAGNFEGNTLGAFMLVLLPVTGFLALRHGHPGARVGFAAGSLLVLVALLVSYSRGAYLGLVGVSLPALVVLGRRQPLAALAIALGGAVLLLFLVNQLPGAEDRLVTFRSLSEDSTVQHRQLVYGRILESVTESPIWGVGLGTSVGVIGTGADSLYLFVLLRGGILAAGAFIALVWVAGRHLLIALRSRWLTGLDLAVAFGLMGFAVHSLVDYAIWNPKLALTVWLLVGFLMAAALERRESPPSRPEDDQAGLSSAEESQPW